jgi:hypothetical protein
MIKEAVEQYLDETGQENVEALHQPIEGVPRLHELTIDAPSLLHT